MIQGQSIELKTSLEVARMRRPGRIVAQVLRSLRECIRPGISTAAIASEAERLLETLEAAPALKGYRGFPRAVCTSVNHVAVHGVPNEYELSKNDVITVDLTVEKGGWHGDSAWTYMVGPGTPEARRLIRAAWRSTIAGIDAARAGARFGDVGRAIEEVAAQHGCTVIDRFVGHGIGKRIHEDPMVLHTGEAGTGAPIVPGMVFTVEPILALGDADVFTLADGWSMVTRDHSLCAQFEQTVAVFSDRTEVLTWEGEFSVVDRDFPPF